MLRDQAWERAKGELRSIRPTYISSKDNDDKGKLEKFDKALGEFVTQIEDWGIV